MLPTVEPKAGRTLRITELRICHIPDRVVVLAESTVRRSTVTRSLKGARCRRRAPEDFITELNCRMKSSIE